MVRYFDLQIVNNQKLEVIVNVLYSQRSSPSAINRANLLCLVRFVLAALAVVILRYYAEPNNSVLAASLIGVAVLLDAVDGAVARRLGMSGEIGSLSDLYTDHAVANLLWIFFAVVGAVSLWVPIITSTRDLAVDYFRQVTTVATGKNGFEQVAESRFRWVVSSRFMRAFYGGLKLASWCLLAVVCCWNLHAVGFILPYLIWSTVAVCILRALPALQSGWRYAVYYWSPSH